MTETDLLSQYAKDRSDALFADMVHGHVDLVYSAARRQVRDPTMAADIAQAVFIFSRNDRQVFGARSPAG